MMSRLGYLVTFCAASLCFVLVSSQATPNPADIQRMICNNRSTCDQCVQIVSSSNITLPNAGLCAWCENPTNTSSPKCLPVSSTLLFHALDECPSLQYNFGTCALTVLFILVLILIAIILFFCCCCSVLICCCVLCAKRRNRNKRLEENKYAEEKDSIRQRSAERRAERQAKHEEIRRKYGLNEEGGADGTYRRFE